MNFAATFDAPIDASWRTTTFGVEIELSGLTFGQAYNVLQRALGQTVLPPPTGRPQYTYGWDVTDQQGREWSVKSDVSVARLGSGDSVEVITPPLTSADYPLVKRVADALCASGAQLNETMGVHVHVGVPGLTSMELYCLLSTVYMVDPLMTRALGVFASRSGHYAEPIRSEMLDCVRRTAISSGDLYRAIGCQGSRYRAFNVESFHRHGTVEYRYFNSTVSAEAILGYVQLALALTVHGRTRCKVTAAMKRAAPAQRYIATATGPSASPAYELRGFMLKLGMSGPDFAAARKVLLTRIPGHPAFRTQAQAQAHALRHGNAPARAKWINEWPPAQNYPCAASAVRRARGVTPAPSTAATPALQWISPSSFPADVNDHIRRQYIKRPSAYVAAGARLPYRMQAGDPAYYYILWQVPVDYSSSAPPWVIELFEIDMNPVFRPYLLMQDGYFRFQVESWNRREGFPDSVAKYYSLDEAKMAVPRSDRRFTTRGTPGLSGYRFGTV